MQKSVFKISKMDCPSEENLIRLQLDQYPEIVHLDFDIPNRQLTVFHHGTIHAIEESILSLHLGGSLLGSEHSNQETFEDSNNQGQLLWTVLLINAAFFIIEMTTGIISKSMGLVADSLDMMADAFVYGISLFAVGASTVKKKQLARLSGYIQMALAIIGFMEVCRRFFGHSAEVDYRLMIFISCFALLANALCLFLLNQSDDKEEAHMKASLIFTSNDIIMNAGIIIAGILVMVLQTNFPDLIIGMIVFALVLQGALRILKIGK